MSSLQAQQQALLNALFARPAEQADLVLHSYAIGVGSRSDRGLLAYRANGHALAQRSLLAAYPVLRQLLGEESFADLAHAVWHAHPPQQGDIAQWGDFLPAFIDDSPQLSDVPYLGDVARAEWGLHCCAMAANGVADYGTLELLTSHDPLTLTLQLAPGWVTVRSLWPVGSIWLTHGDDGPAFEEVGEMLHKQIAEDVVIWRAGLRPQLRLALPGELALLEALVAGLSLASALESAEVLDFSQWLPLAVQTGLVLFAMQLPQSTNG